MSIIKTQEQIVQEFNDKYPIGSEVKWTPISNNKNLAKTYKVKTSAFTHFNNAVAFLEGKPGFVSIEPQFIIE